MSEELSWLVVSDKLDFFPSSQIRHKKIMQQTFFRIFKIYCILSSWNAIIFLDKNISYTEQHWFHERN